MKYLRIKAFAATLALAVAPAVQSQSARETLFIASDDLSSVTYAVSGALCQSINRATPAAPYRCALDATPGADAGLAGLRRGDYHFALVSGDVLHHAVNGTGPYAANGPDRDLRAVASLHSRALTVVARRDAGIRAVGDLTGKRVNLGRAGSVTRQEVDEILAAAKLGANPFLLVTDFGPDEQGTALCDSRFDAFVYATGTPSSQVQYPAAACGAQVVPFDGPLARQLVDSRPYFRSLAIPGGTYPNNPQAVGTLGVPTVLVTRADTPAPMVEAVMREIAANFERFRTLHPALGVLVAEGLPGASALAPLHPAAEAAYRQLGWIRKP